MKKQKLYHYLWVVLCSTLLLCAAASERQYKIKAGFLYNFLLFAQWPEQTFPNLDSPIIIGILGDNPFTGLFDIVEGKPVNGRILVIKELKKNAPASQLKNCHLLFISPSIRKGNPNNTNLKEILKKLNGSPVLTVGESDSFTESGGMINFIVKGNNITFEINKDAVDRSGIRLSSKLLRLAIRVIRD